MSEGKKMGFWDAVGKIAKKAFASEKTDPVEALTDAASEVGAEIRDGVREAARADLRREAGVVDVEGAPVVEERRA